MLRLLSILMDATMNIKITDLGFAAQLAEGESLRDLFGTPGKTKRPWSNERSIFAACRLHGA